MRRGRLLSQRRARRSNESPSLELVLEDKHWDYLMFGVQPTHGPILHRGIVHWPRHSKRNQWGPTARERPRRKGLRSSWRWK